MSRAQVDRAVVAVAAGGLFVAIPDDLRFTVFLPLVVAGLLAGGR